MNRVVSAPIPDDSARWLAQLALLAQQELLELINRHGGHRRGGHHHHAGHRVAPPIQKHPHHAMRPLARFFASKASLPPTQHPHAGARLLSQLTHLIHQSPAHAASVMASIAKLPLAQAQQLMQTLSSLSPELAHTLGQLITQLPLNQVASFIQLLAQLPPDMVQALIVALAQNQLEALIDAHPDMAETLTQFKALMSPKQKKKSGSDEDDSADDDAEASERLKKGWERWAAFLNQDSPLK